MTAKPIIVRHFLEGWGIQDREWRGPYYSQEIAVRVGIAELKRRHAIVPDLRLLVLGEDGAVFLEWPETALPDDLVLAESPSELPSKPTGAPRSDRGLRDWRDDPRRYHR